MTVGLIGFGRLGRLLVRYFARRVPILVHDTRGVAKEVRAMGAQPASFDETCACDVVIPAVPIRALEGVLKRMAPKLKKGALVADVCSVKEEPARLMKKLLPATVDLLATHPNFGPDSAAESLVGRTLILHPLRLAPSRYAEVKRLLAIEGLRLVEMTPAAHDKKAAESLVLTHFVGRGLVRFGAKTTGIDTEGYTRLLRILQTVQNDSWELFEDMNRRNRYAAPMRRRFLAALEAVDGKLPK